jgi:histidinol-phosphatase (PHP family)
MMTTAAKTNFHTHTTFCDGKAEPELMIQSAISRGLSVLGFSGHSMYPFASRWHMSCADHERYCTEIRRLAQQYRSQIDIRLGFESDYFPGVCIPRFDHYGAFAPDYLIGSVHYIYTGTGYFEADGAPETVSDGIRTLFHGNARHAVGAYFSLQREMLHKGDFTILGHADLIRKTNGTLHFFDERDGWYRRELAATAKAIAQTGVIVEINTGGMARGYLTTPYPSDNFLSLLHDAGVPVTIDSDSHAPDTIDFAFDQARTCAKKAGYTELTIPAAGSYTFIPL